MGGVIYLYGFFCGFWFDLGVDLLRLDFFGVSDSVTKIFISEMKII